MKRVLLVVASLSMSLVGVGCDDTTATTIRPDLSMKPSVDGGTVDLAVGGSPVGGDCTKNGDCKTGTNPFCLKNTRVTGSAGVCAADCTTDADCGSLSTCITFSNGQQCVKNCMAATDCGTGFACYIGLGCYPTDAIKLDCDPTVANCTNATITSGGCVRQAVGTGMTGQCSPTCDVGVATCPAKGTTKEHCLVEDTTIDTMQMATGDKFKGAICQSQAPTADQKAEGMECLVGTAHYIDACLDGLECDSIKTATNTAPDNKCHRLCYATASMPSYDGGAPVPDGGMVAAMGCTTGTCKDVYSLFGTSQPIGLCE